MNPKNSVFFQNFVSIFFFILASLILSSILKNIKTKKTNLNIRKCKPFRLMYHNLPYLICIDDKNSIGSYLERLGIQTDLPDFEKNRVINEGQTCFVKEQNPVSSVYCRKMSPYFRLKFGMKININTANRYELALLPNIGLKKADRIIEFRTQFHKFKNTNDLKKIKGIGKQTIKEISPLIEF